MEPCWSLVVPVKRLTWAKSRLAGLTGPRRAELALAMACDTVAAALSCPNVAAVFTVTDDADAAEALREVGSRVVTGEPGTGLNAALVHGAAEAARQRPGDGVCALNADLPALRPGELERALDEAGGAGRSFLPDAPGVGTTLYAAAPGAGFAPGFGGASRRRHSASGAVELRHEGVDTLRRDVDTPADLRAAAALGLGPHTTKLMSRLDP
ncbi:2-phospho-L-lactate guanylyltransferase [Haloactinospora alba]|uniref:Phosphoenolpyruvate guanylyltransferase n=1 Tax=Haloactinospora alba TaxID=405555 RepID=A0A543NL40_9ACTN|nr:2-phospho-L-lactate guanylyltransferase [Haloactinospora alba]TQN32548.1 2-phospho-L-lactate guanylyltransferase [Haloactinospora alba]